MKRSLLVVLVLSLPGAAIAQNTPDSVSFTARLVDNGTPVTGTRTIQLALYDAGTGGTEIWTEMHSGVTVTDGLLYVEMGAVSSLDAFTFDGSKRWLQVSVNGTVMTPRVPIVSVPYAIRAGVAAEAESLGGRAPDDFVTGVQAGTGLTGGGSTGDVTVAVDATYVQRRVGACPAGETIRSIAADGTPTCLPVGTGDVTSIVTAPGSGLVGGATAGDATLALISCAAGDTLIYGVAGWTCGPGGDISGITTAAGSGLTGGTTSGAADLALISCAAGDILEQGPFGWQCNYLDGTEILTRLNDNTQTTGVFSIDRLPVGTTSGTVAAGNHVHIAPIPPATTQADARLSCRAIRDAGISSGDGLYWIDPNGGSTADAFRVYCEMSTLTGGWTLVMNVNPADGNFVPFSNTAFWLSDAEYGQIVNHFTHDYKGPAAWTLPGTEVLVAIAQPGPEGRVIGWKAWTMPLKTFDTFFDGAAANSTQTTTVLDSNVTNVYAYEPIIKNGTHLQSNRMINPNADRVRLGVNGYSAQGDDNQPGLGTQMNEGICGAGNLCYRYRDVELWVNSTSNLWCSAPGVGSYKWIGTDGGCGASCAGSGQCDAAAGPGYSPYWTYRIYVR